MSMRVVRTSRYIGVIMEPSGALSIEWSWSVKVGDLVIMRKEHLEHRQPLHSIVGIVMRLRRPHRCEVRWTDGHITVPLREIIEVIPKQKSA